jgi:hypothetical protein
MHQTETLSFGVGCTRTRSRGKQIDADRIDEHQGACLLRPMATAEIDGVSRSNIHATWSSSPSREKRGDRGHE